MLEEKKRAEGKHGRKIGKGRMGVPIEIYKRSQENIAPSITLMELKFLSNLEAMCEG
jgi:hypothetical protein